MNALKLPTIRFLVSLHNVCSHIKRTECWIRLQHWPQWRFDKPASHHGLLVGTLTFDPRWPWTVLDLVDMTCGRECICCYCCYMWAGRWLWQYYRPAVWQPETYQCHGEFRQDQPQADVLSHHWPRRPVFCDVLHHLMAADFMILLFPVQFYMSLSHCYLQTCYTVMMTLRLVQVRVLWTKCRRLTSV